MVTREMKDAVNRRLQYDTDWLSEEGYAFIYRCLFDLGLSLLDTDEYAILNTLIGCDIGVENAMRISGFLWEKEIDIMELSPDEQSRQDVQQAIDTMHLPISLENWKTTPWDGYTYYPASK